jgi:RNA polymerase sigma factor (sigma-70 family)
MKHQQHWLVVLEQRPLIPSPMKDLTFSAQICGYRTSLMQSAMKFTGNNDDADDLVQDTMIKAIRYETMYKEGTNLRGWLFTIMKNTFINNYRSL